VYRDSDIDNDPYSNIQINSQFYDMHSFPSILNNGTSPIFLSINIQSLTSKFEELKQQILDLSNKKIIIDVIAIQETWEIKYPELLAIPGFQKLVFKTRNNMRGGGVGFYVRNGLNFKIVDNMSPFEQKIFESITIQISYPNKSYLLTSAYRSNGSLPNLTSNQQLERFQTLFEDLLSKLNRSRLTSYVFIDSNIDLLNIANETSSSYLNTIFSYGFLQQIMKTTRMQNQSKTLIDHVLSNSSSNSIFSGTVISDISDHFFTFARPILSTPKKSEKTTFVRSFSVRNLNNFKAALGGTDWSNVSEATNVDEAYDIFWKSYTDLFELNFPKKRSRFNQNIHKRSPFMTAGLLVSRKTKNLLFKLQLENNSEENIQKYKNFKQIYARTLRAAKKLYFKKKLQDNIKNPKKTWDTLNEVLS
jgi:hypothetical protein